MAYGVEKYGTLGYKCETVPDEVQLAGNRVFKWRPDWKDGVTLSYFANTIISESSRYIEQRRAQYATLKRKQSFAVADDDYTPELEMWLRRWHSSVVWMPIWSERLVATTAVLQGETVIEVEDTLGRFSLNSIGGFVVVLDRNLVLAPEIFRLESVAATSVTLSAVVVGAYTSANAMLFPAFSAIHDTNQITDITAHYRSASLVWREWF
jgi:hypothetical protein